MSRKTAESGQIWKCVKTCMSNHDKKERRVVIEEGELVEFRYWHPANFRTIEGKFYAVEKEVFFSHFEYVGDVFEEVRFRNQNTLKEIIDCRLYKPV